MESSLKQIASRTGLQLSLIVTGMHLSAKHGRTITDIERSGLPIASIVSVKSGPSTGLLMAQNIGRMLIGIADAIADQGADLLLVLGDRGEMLAAALAAIHLNIPVAHIHGGERSGTIDEPVRHAISKLAHLHFAATTEGRDRLIRMGEKPSNVFVVGAPGLDGLAALAGKDRATIAAQFGLDPNRKFALMVFHPVVQDADGGAHAVETTLSRLRANGFQVFALLPNSDVGSEPIRKVLLRWKRKQDVVVAVHLCRSDYVSMMAAADVMIGNSSSGIIEAATFGTPVVNVGSRQNLRQRSANVIDVEAIAEDLDRALVRASGMNRSTIANVYGDGRAGERLSRLLETIELAPELMQKVNAY